MKNNSFKLGDRVVIIKSPVYPERVGMVTTFVSELRQPLACPPSTEMFIKLGTMVHSLDIPSPILGMTTISPPDWLELYKDDGNEKGEWTSNLIKLCNSKNIKEIV